MSLFESLSLNNVRHIIHQRLYTQNLSNKAETKNKNVRKEHNLKPKNHKWGLIIH